MTTKQGFPLIGATGYIYYNGLKIRVGITDVKQSYGKTRYEVEPMEGEGRAWVESIEIEK